MTNADDPKLGEGYGLQFEFSTSEFEMHPPTTLAVSLDPATVEEAYAHAVYFDGTPSRITQPDRPDVYLRLLLGYRARARLNRYEAALRSLGRGAGQFIIAPNATPWSRS